VDQEAIIRYVAETFAGVEIARPTDGPGAFDTFFMYDPEGNLDAKQKFPFATIVTKDYGDFDNTSQLDRPGVFRLNIGLSRTTFISLFPSDATGFDPAALDQLMPHPVYASQSWVSVLNPSAETFERLKPLLAEAYSRAAGRRVRSET
jgi:Family of unknown function (DUF6194)